MVSAVPQRIERSRVLVVGVYLLGAPTWVHEITETLTSTRAHDVEVLWAALGQGSVPEALADITPVVASGSMDKFTLVNQVIAHHDLSNFDVLLVTDDDVSFEPGWLDAFLSFQADADLALCQPARSPDSWIDHPFTKQLLGIDARLTHYVEIGPVFSLHRKAFELLVPFDESWPMGWGLDLRWPVILGEAGLQMGIIDRVPVRHRLRPPQAHYSAGRTRDRMSSALDGASVLDRDTAQRALSTRVEGRWSTSANVAVDDPKISVVIATRNREDLLTKALGALVAQNIDRDDFEVIVIDDGSTDDIRRVIDKFAGLLHIQYARQDPSGLASARNHGLFLSNGEIVIFLDDDDVADTSLLAVHVAAHRRYPEPQVAILGYTGLAVDVGHSFLMRHITGAAGNQYLSHVSMMNQGMLDFTEFWGGRASAKRSWLVQHEVFDPQFDFGFEDIELGYRLDRHGLVVRYEAQARLTVMRTFTLDGFLQRTMKQGHSMAMASSLHPDSSFVTTAHLVDDERFASPDPQLIEELTRRTQELLDLADDAIAHDVLLAPSVEAEIGHCINYLHHVYLVQGYHQFLSEHSRQTS